MSKQLDVIKHYEPQKLVRYIKPQATRHVSLSFNAELKKYAIIPVTASKGDECSYTLKLQFRSLKKHVNLDNAYKTSSIVSQSPTPEEMKKFSAANDHVKQIKTPFNVDSYINTRDANKIGKNKDSITENVRLVMNQDLAFEDEAIGMTKHLISADEMADMEEEVKTQIMMGIDRDAEEEEKKQLKSMTED